MRSKNDQKQSVVCKYSQCLSVTWEREAIYATCCMFTSDFLWILQGKGGKWGLNYQLHHYSTMYYIDLFWWRNNVVFKENVIIDTKFLPCQIINKIKIRKSCFLTKVKFINIKHLKFFFNLMWFLPNFSKKNIKLESIQTETLICVFLFDISHRVHF